MSLLAFSKTLVAIYRSLYCCAAPAKSGDGISLLKILTDDTVLCVAYGHISMVGRAGASKDAPVSVRLVRLTPSGCTTSEISLSSGGIFITHWRLPYGNHSHFRMQFTRHSLQRRYQLHHSGGLLRALR
ncbi:TPA: ash family protein [Escherichia coli]|nr:ash family protein [Escherichia coli]